MNNQIKSHAKRAYEKGRIIAASKYLWLVLPVFLISICTCGSATLPIIAGTLLAITVVVLKWRGEEFGFSVIPGLVSGLVAFAIPLTLHLLEICCQNDLEVFLCVLSGAIGGLLAGYFVGKSKRNHKSVSLIFAVIVSGLTATLGCASLGYNALAGLFIALAVGSIISFKFKSKFVLK